MDDHQTKIKAAAEWAAALYEVRTIAVSEQRATVLEIHPAYRVDWHEVRAQYSLSGPEDRIDFQPAFEAAIKKRGLSNVLKGKETASEWHKRKKQQ